MGRTLAGRLAGIGLVLALLLTAAPATEAQVQAEVRATGTPGIFAFSATGFGGNDTISTWMTGPSQQVVFTGYYDVGSGGTVSFEMLVPRHFQPGRWAITMQGLDTDEQAVATFDAPLRPADLTLAVDRPSGPVGTTFAFASTGFAADEFVSFWLTGPDGKSYEGDIVQVTSEGRLDFTFLVGEGTQPGTWTVSAYGQTSDRLGVVSFTVTG